jgi:DNA polymerase I
MSKWLLIDGFNLAYRCFHALPELTSSKGFPTGALHGWVKSIWKLIDQEKPDATLVFFDLGESDARVKLLAEYKAQRKPMPDPLRQQIEPIKQLTRAMGLAGIEENGVESDDLLASEAVALARAGHDVLIVSSDKDFAQIVDEKIKIMLPPPSANPKLGWRLLDAAGVQEKFGVPPSQIAHYLRRRLRTTWRWWATRRTIFPASMASVRRRQRNGSPSAAAVSSACWRKRRS